MPNVRIEYFTSPRGFPTKVSPAEVTKLISTYREISDKPTTWAERKKYILLAKECIGGLYLATWLSFLKESGYLYGRRFDFLEDTLNFITTGKRKMSTGNWKELLEDFPSEDRRSVRKDLFIEAGKITVAELITLWCVQPKGLEDMICTLDIFFGEERSTDLPQMRRVEHLHVKPFYN